jgi:hypothetical protein
MAPGAEVDPLPHWITWRMLPHVPTYIEGQQGAHTAAPPSRADAEKADWVVFYGIEPRSWALRRQVKLDVQHFAPGLSIGRRGS